MKNIHVCDNFFYSFVKVLIIALAMNIVNCKTINFFCTWLSQLDGPNLIIKIESLYGPYTISDIGGKVKQDVETGIEILLTIRKAKLGVSKDQPDSLPKPNKDQVETELIADLSTYSRNIYRKNTLISISYGLLYLDFRNACRKGYIGRIEKCIKLFAILFQSSNYKNYATKTIHFIVYFKYIWKNNFR